MNYILKIKLNDKDYLDFNSFHLFKSAYGRKIYNRLRIFTLVIPFICWLLGFTLHSFSEDYFTMLIVLIPLVLILFFTIKPILNFITKMQFRTMIKNGKKPYSAEATMEFSDEKIIETTEDNRTELKYSAVDSVYVVKGEMIYIYVNVNQAYLIPYASFENKNQFIGFIEFISEKTKPVIYSI